MVACLARPRARPDTLQMVDVDLWEPASGADERSQGKGRQAANHRLGYLYSAACAGKMDRHCRSVDKNAASEEAGGVVKGERSADAYRRATSIGRD
jgi:hypothetical protein